MYKTENNHAHPPLPAARAFLLLAGLIVLFASPLAACQPTGGQASPPGNPPTLTIAPASPTPRPTQTRLPASPSPGGCSETSGTINSGVIETKLLDKPMRYNVYLPPCYAAETDKRYPVLYLLHGQNYDEQQWIRIGAISTAERLTRAGELPRLIIVMPYDYSFKQPTEYNFEQVFIETLLPLIDQTYRTQAQSAARAIGGLSRGGAWAIHLGIRHPDLFGALGAHSPAVFYSDMETMRLRLRDADPDHFPRIFIDAGIYNSEYKTALPFADLLDEMNIPHEWHAYVGFHDEEYWSAHVEEYLRWYAAEWK